MLSTRKSLPSSAPRSSEDRSALPSVPASGGSPNERLPPRRTDRHPGRRRALLAVALTIGLGLLVLPVVLSDGASCSGRRRINPGCSRSVALTLCRMPRCRVSYQGSRRRRFHLSLRQLLRTRSLQPHYTGDHAGCRFAVPNYRCPSMACRRGARSSSRCGRPSSPLPSSSSCSPASSLSVCATIIPGRARRRQRAVSFPVVLAYGGAGLHRVCGVERYSSSPVRLASGAASFPTTPGRVKVGSSSQPEPGPRVPVLARPRRGPGLLILLDLALTLAILLRGFRAVQLSDRPRTVVVDSRRICLSLVSLVPAGSA